MNRGLGLYDHRPIIQNIVEGGGHGMLFAKSGSTMFTVGFDRGGQLPVPPHQQNLKALLAYLRVPSRTSEAPCQKSRVPPRLRILDEGTRDGRVHRVPSRASGYRRAILLMLSPAHFNDPATHLFWEILTYSGTKHTGFTNGPNPMKTRNAVPPPPSRIVSALKFQALDSRSP